MKDLLETKIEGTQQEVVKLFIPALVHEKINYLCKVIREVEWSGILLYSVKGTIKNPKELELTAEDIIPMNKGSQAYTEYQFNEPKRDGSGYDDKMIDYFNERPDTIRKKWRIGLIHSHNTMPVFFSGTDVSELKDNCGAHSFYLSLIVNNKLEMTAKIAFKSIMTKTAEEDFFATDEEGKKYKTFKRNVNFVSEEMIVHDCSIFTEPIVPALDKLFLDNVESIIEAAKVPSFHASAQSLYGSSNVYMPTGSRFPDGSYRNPAADQLKQLNEIENALKPHLGEKKKKEIKDTEIDVLIEEFLIQLLSDEDSPTCYYLTSMLRDLEQDHIIIAGESEPYYIEIDKNDFTELYNLHFGDQVIMRKGVSLSEKEKKRFVLGECINHLENLKDMFPIAETIAKVLGAINFNNKKHDNHKRKI